MWTNAQRSSSGITVLLCFAPCADAVPLSAPIEDRRGVGGLLPRLGTSQPRWPAAQAPCQPWRASHVPPTLPLPHPRATHAPPTGRLVVHAPRVCTARARAPVAPPQPRPLVLQVRGYKCTDLHCPLLHPCPGLLARTDCSVSTASVRCKGWMNKKVCLACVSAAHPCVSCVVDRLSLKPSLPPLLLLCTSWFVSPLSLFYPVLLPRGCVGPLPELRFSPRPRSSVPRSPNTRTQHPRSGAAHSRGWCSCWHRCWRRCRGGHRHSPQWTKRPR